MLVDDLGPSAPDKLDGEVVKRSDLALEPDPIRQKDGDFTSVVAEVLQNRSWRVEGLCATISCSCCKLACLGSKLPLDDVLPIKIRLDDPAVLLA